MGITHATTPAGSDSGDSKISKNAWTEDHVVTGILVTASDEHGNSVADVTEIHFLRQWVVDQGDGVVNIADYDPDIYPATLTWDTNAYDGVFNHLGVAAGGGTFENPHPSYYKAEMSSTLSGGTGPENATDHEYSEATGTAHTYNNVGEWWRADFGSGHTFQPTHLGIIGRSSGGNHPRNFKLQGSNDTAAWTDLLTVVSDGPATGSWWGSDVTGASAYRYLRIYMTGLNSDTGWYLTLGEVEMWGHLT
jgi:hypothetical protein